MEIVLIPGFWLDGSSWDQVVPALKQAGRQTHALTPSPGSSTASATAPASAGEWPGATRSTRYGCLPTRRSTSA